MTAQSRSSISSLNVLKFPTNNAKLIKAKDLRDFEEVINESKFNLIDDELNDIGFDNSGTDIAATTAGAALIEVNNKIGSNSILMEGTVSIGDVGNSDPTLVVTGDILTGAKEHTSKTRTTITFADIGTSNYFPVISIENTGVDSRNVYQYTWSNRTSTSLIIDVNESSSNEQFLKFHIRLKQN